ncbi:MAG: hypothetical protein M5U26_18620 [Planctomycetota bacterium]|nr:hypothetical protein [Planctomycetota bacterium]
MGRRRLKSCAGWLVLLSGFAFAAEAPPPLPVPADAGMLPEAVKESSGLAVSAARRGVWWTHPDSGNPPCLWAVSPAGALLATCTFKDVSNRDWEDLAFDEKGRLVVADIGNNSRARTELQLYRFAEPDPEALNRPGAAPPAAQVFRFTYPESVGVQDAEALIVRAGFAYVFTKEKDRVRCVRVPLPEEPPKEPIAAEPLGESKLIALATAADLSADGKHLALLTYAQLVVVELPAPLEATQAAGAAHPDPFTGIVRRTILRPRQYEAVAWDGKDLLLTAESRQVLRVPGAAP